MSSRRWSALIVLMVSGAAASAQAQVASPSVGGEAGGRPGDSHMALRVAAFGATETVAEDVAGSGGINPGVQAALDFGREGRRVTVAWTTTGSVQRLGWREPILPLEGTTGFTLSTRVTRRATVQVTQNVASSPRYTFGFTPLPTVGDVPSAVGGAGVVGRDRTISFDTAAALAYAAGRHSTISVEYGHRQSTVLRSEQTGFSADRVSARFTRQLSSSMSARIGYGVQRAVHAAAADTVTLMHDIDVGVDYRGGIRLGRRTSLSFASGTAILASGERGEQRHATLTGTAALDHGFGRTWAARLAYDRGVRFDDRVAAPTVTDAITAGVGGSLGRRMSASLGAGYASGTLGIGGDRYDSVSATAALEYAMTRRVALFARSSLYEYGFLAPERLPEGLTGQTNQWNAYVGIAWQVPILR